MPPSRSLPNCWSRTGKFAITSRIAKTRGGNRFTRRLAKKLQEKTGRRINIKIEELNRPEIVAQLVAEDIAEQLEKRAGFRRTMKRAMEQTMEAGAKGVKK